MPDGHWPNSSTPGIAGRSTELTEEEIRTELQAVLASHEFRASKRSQDFLRFVTNATLGGNTETLKERTIAVEVFGRPATYDPSEDATVRVKAGEVRKRLGLYYANEGSHSRIRIDIPSGTYVPEFRTIPAEFPYVRTEGERSSDSKPKLDNLAEAKKSFSLSRATLLRVAVVGFAVLGMSFLMWPKLRSTSPIERFWGPVLQGDIPVSVCAEYVPVWSLDRPPSTIGEPRIEEFTYLTDQFVGGGDLVAVGRLTGMLGERGHAYRIRIGADVTFEDLRAAPAVLVGYSQTRWRAISSQLRYFIDASRSPVMVTDNGEPTKWYLPNLPRDRRTSEDYAVVSRVFHPDTHRMLVGISGITQYGTEAASDLVTRPDLLADALRNAPAGWERKNLQFVLHVKVIAGAATSPKVVATHVW
jgi:hypothetical protein